VILIAVAAAIDALRAEDPAEEPSGNAPQRATKASSSRNLERAGVSGALYIAIPQADGCELRDVRLPTLALAGSLGMGVCRVSLSPDGRHVAEAYECPGRDSLIHDLLVPSLARFFRGCAPAWKPDGTFTFVRGGDVVAARELDCLGAVGCLRVVLAKREIERGLRPIATAYGARSVTIRLVDWLSDTRLVSIVRLGTRPRLEFLSIFERSRHVGVPGFRQSREPGFPFSVSELQASSERQEIIAGATGRGFFAFDRRGRFRNTNPFPFADTVAATQSPDGRWRAIARPESVCIWSQTEPRFPIDCLRVDAVDLAWR
jgi:hypothetical protein